MAGESFLLPISEAFGTGPQGGTDPVERVFGPSAVACGGGLHPAELIQSGPQLYRDGPGINDSHISLVPPVSQVTDCRHGKTDR